MFIGKQKMNQTFKKSLVPQFLLSLLFFRTPEFCFSINDISEATGTRKTIFS